MRLVDSSLNVDICLSYDRPTVLVIENKESFMQFSFDLWNQSNGKDGNVILSERDSFVRFDKAVELVINPFGINFNDKKIITKVYSELEDLCNESYIEEISSINADIISLFDTLEQKIDYPLHFSIDIDLKGMFKLQDVKIEESDDVFLDRLISYIKLVHQVCHVRVFIFVNLKTFFSNDMLEELYKACAYEEIIVMDVENHDFGKEIVREQYFVIDEDLCLIEV